MTLEEEFLSEVIPDKTRPNKRKKGINSKQKGSSNERDCVKIFNKRFEGEYFMRAPQSGAFLGQSNRNRADGMDAAIQATFTSDIVPKNSELGFYFSIEHKAYNEASFWDLFNDGSDLHRFMEQAENDARSINKEPMLIIHYNKHNRIVWVKKETNINHIMEHRGWKCYWLNDLLLLPNDWFFSNWR